MWHELHFMVSEQQEYLDSIENNVQQTKDYIIQATMELQKGHEHQKKTRKTCHLFFFLHILREELSTYACTFVFTTDAIFPYLCLLGCSANHSGRAWGLRNQRGVANDLFLLFLDDSKKKREGKGKGFTCFEIAKKKTNKSKRKKNIIIIWWCGSLCCTNYQSSGKSIELKTRFKLTKVFSLGYISKKKNVIFSFSSFNANTAQKKKSLQLQTK
ncbi:hypothetical protein RFI_13675 [Reticulomyxa filosa]|uniref:t-SNARE coiled-coil homology domain-containing protein n=1 Tax=Reticulomyxa filosa TaxID=46433 RepID=X6NC76_RETFI|nr:hypothetical protein RFI_13675 [Reticulomyxa filosa]|eukprot:ETO23503.1 hypothetical protein RFI_13675 [Reticulomyxa filosa]